MADDHTLTDDGDEPQGHGLGFGLDELDFAAEAEAQQPAPPPGNVNITARLSDGTVYRVVTVGEEIRLTLATGDGMATAAFAPDDVEMLADALGAGMRDIRKRRNGWSR